LRRSRRAWAGRRPPEIPRVFSSLSHPLLPRRPQDGLKTVPARQPGPAVPLRRRDAQGAFAQQPPQVLGRGERLLQAGPRGDRQRCAGAVLGVRPPGVLLAEERQGAAAEEDRGAAGTGGGTEAQPGRRSARAVVRAVDQRPVGRSIAPRRPGRGLPGRHAPSARRARSDPPRSCSPRPIPPRNRHVRPSPIHGQPAKPRNNRPGDAKPSNLRKR
jgi:hypothetical protein